MQVNNINQELIENLIKFFGNQFLNQGYFYSNTPSKVLKDMIGNISYYIEHGFKETWCLGWTIGSCFSDSLSTISPEIEPELKTLDEFFIEFYPQISFMQYKVISSFIDKDTYSDYDYYGGSTTHGKKQLTIQKLQEAFVKAKIIQPENTVSNYSIEDNVKLMFSDKIHEKFKPKNKMKK